jgi:hypothetical protein
LNQKRAAAKRNTSTRFSSREPRENLIGIFVSQQSFSLLLASQADQIRDVVFLPLDNSRSIEPEAFRLIA